MAQPVSATPSFARAAHIRFVKSLESATESFEYYVTEHLRMSGVYWGLCTMELMEAGGEMDRAAIVEWVLQCQHPCGGFGGNVGHDPHMLYTCSAVQILALCRALDRLDEPAPSAECESASGVTRRAAAVRYIASLQQADGSFAGDEWLEIDCRFIFCAALALSILKRVDAIDRAAGVAYLARSRNFDGGFGAVPGAESHAGMIFCCVGALSLLGGLEESIDADLLGWWLCERQCDSGGLNGRPEKQADVCYSWWVLSALSALGRSHWLDGAKLVGFILKCQDADDGGIADRPDDLPDVFHTFFGACGLSLLGYFAESGVPHKKIDPIYALPCDLVAELGLASQTLTCTSGVAAAPPRSGAQ
jgi:geranylgeranyl transferase type-2 subunit beta